ncbi:MAG: transcriptional regulator [Rhodobacterales bacterium 12-64-8]|nr:MAG: transcriptional regulator [Rhodobacterales bacterium 12-64-8]OYX50996.1 MAG: transcriptional regulator [Alphaproteobacteria bacterium 32-64-14]
MITTFKILAVAASALAVTGCVSPWANEAGLYATPIGDAPVTANPTPYSNALVCMANYATATGKARPRIAVGRVLDYTGKVDLEGGRQVTQGASLMAMSAFAKAGAHLVERFDTSVSELELKYSNNRLIGADPGVGQGPAEPEFRQIMAGEIPGSDYYFVGGITELNSNIRSVGIDAFIGDLDPTDAKGRAGFKAFVINVGVDLRLVSTKTLEVVDLISYQKQIIGREISAGIFDFANGNIFDVGAGERAMEPIQLAIRSTIERSVLEMTANLYGVANADPCGALAQETQGMHQPQSVTGTAIRLPGGSLITDGGARADPNRWNENRDEGVKAALRGRRG